MRNGGFRECPHLENRDMGRPILWRVKVWVTRQIENRLRTRRQTTPEGHLCRQGQRPRGLAILAAGRELVRGLNVVCGSTPESPRPKSHYVACQNFGKNLYTLRFASAHQHQIQSLPPEPHLSEG
jgi:hypothetical protein